MAIFHRIKVTCTTTGTGALTLPPTGVRDLTNGDCLAPAEILSQTANRLVSYNITNGGNFAYGEGVISTNGLILTRDIYEQSWNGTTLSTAILNLTGTSTVMITPGAADFGAGRRGRAIALSRGQIFIG